jgi:hypothetical protein
MAILKFMNSIKENAFVGGDGPGDGERLGGCEAVSA